MDTPCPPRAQAAPAEETGFAGLLDTIQAAVRLGVSKRTVQELVAGRKLASIKFGRNVRFHPADIEAFVASHRVQSIDRKEDKR